MATRNFESAFHSGGSGCVRTCECGATYFDNADRGIDWEEGELEDLEEKSIKWPLMFIGEDCSIPTFIVFGKNYVCGCPCGLAETYEHFINHHEKQIARYLNEKSDRLKKRATEIKIKD